VGSVHTAFIKRKALSEASDERRWVDAKCAEWPEASASAQTDLEPTAAQLVERAQGLGQMKRRVQRRDEPTQPTRMRSVRAAANVIVSIGLSIGMVPSTCSWVQPLS
jgi:hypothetical protein